jgi:hypothetical protein
MTELTCPKVGPLSRGAQERLNSHGDDKGGMGGGGGERKKVCSFLCAVMVRTLMHSHPCHLSLLTVDDGCRLAVAVIPAVWHRRRLVVEMHNAQEVRP